jgi:hypothetical protein
MDVPPVPPAGLTPGKGCSVMRRRSGLFFYARTASAGRSGFVRMRIIHADLSSHTVPDRNEVQYGEDYRIRIDTQPNNYVSEYVLAVTGRYFSDPLQFNAFRWSLALGR